MNCFKTLFCCIWISSHNSKSINYVVVLLYKHLPPFPLFGQMFTGKLYPLSLKGKEYDRSLHCKTAVKIDEEWSGLVFFPLSALQMILLALRFWQSYSFFQLWLPHPRTSSLIQFNISIPFCLLVFIHITQLLIPFYIFFLSGCLWLTLVL